MLSDHQIKKYLGNSRAEYCDEAHVSETIRKSKAAFYESEAEGMLSSAEFLYRQSRYIKKYWWVLQGIVLLLLWGCMEMTEHNVTIQRCMGAAAPLFAVLILPELWKNKNTGTMEIECSAFYSLRQVYAARMILFAVVDFVLLTVFCTAVIFTEKMKCEDILIQFLLPYTVTCCICFRCLYSRIGSEVFVLFLCVLWSGIWIQIVLQDKVYTAVSEPIWCMMLAAAAFYLGFCIYRGQKKCNKIWEEKPLWN